MHERRQSQIQVLNETPLYPTDKLLWDENVVPTEYFSGEGKSFWVWFGLGLINFRP